MSLLGMPSYKERVENQELRDLMVAEVKRQANARATEQQDESAAFQV